MGLSDHTLGDHADMRAASMVPRILSHSSRRHSCFPLTSHHPGAKHPTFVQPTTSLPVQAAKDSPIDDGWHPMTPYPQDDADGGDGNAIHDGDDEEAGHTCPPLARVDLAWRGPVPAQHPVGSALP
mmetsp:Transcript_19885/g.46249  ORF Transcript_19885/g.46249 Transcript_19885/m.46249 type:complete len:126 (+) Transcript_19885:1391-1768(+)